MGSGSYAAFAGDGLANQAKSTPDGNRFTMTSPAPLPMDRLTSRDPIPQPGIVRDRQYLA